MEGFVEVGNWPVIEAPLTLFNEQVEVVFGDAVIGPQVALCLVPKVLNAVDVIRMLGKEF